MAQSLIPTLEKMNMKGDLVSNWEYFKDSWNNYATATELSKKSEEIVVATLLSIMGKECHQIYKNLPLSAEERKKKTETVLAKLTEHFEPKRNIIYERYIFNTVSQEQDESFDQFLNRLQELAAMCNFGTLEEEMIRDRIMIGIRDNCTRKRLLREPDLKLERAIDTCRTNELATKQRQKMEKTEIDNYIRAKQRPSNSHQYCGGVHARGNCPAYGKTCTACK